MSEENKIIDTAEKKTAKKPAVKAASAEAQAPKKAKKAAEAETVVAEEKTVKTVTVKEADKTVAVRKAKAEKTETAKAAKTNKKQTFVKITLTKSVLGSKKDQIATVTALGLKKVRQSNVIINNAATQGMIFKVKHLVSVEEVKQEVL